MSKLLVGMLLLLVMMAALTAERVSAQGDVRGRPFALARETTLTEPVALDGCAALDSPGEYRVVAELHADWDCIKIQTSNVTLDCANHSIVGKWFRGNGIMLGEPGGAARHERIEIKNCRISNFLYGIAVEGGRAIAIHDNNLSGNFDDTHGSYHGAWLGLVDGGGLRVNAGTDITIEVNVANAGANGIDVRDSARILIRKNTTTQNSANGIVLTNTSDSVIEGNTVSDNVRWCTFPSEGGDVVVPGCDSAGIMLQDGSSRNRVRDNLLWGQNGDGIFVRNHTGRCGDDTVIENNQIVGAVWNGIEAGFCNRIQISGNEFSRSKFGVWISYMDGAAIQNNRFQDMEQAGVVLKNSHHALIQNNSFSRSAEGIFLLGDTRDEQFGWTLRHPFAYYRSYANLVTGNSFDDLTRTGIHLSNSTANRITANRFTNVPILWMQGESEK